MNEKMFIYILDHKKQANYYDIFTMEECGKQILYSFYYNVYIEIVETF